MMPIADESNTETTRASRETGDVVVEINSSEEEGEHSEAEDTEQIDVIARALRRYSILNQRRNHCLEHMNLFIWYGAYITFTLLFLYQLSQHEYLDAMKPLGALMLMGMAKLYFKYQELSGADENSDTQPEEGSCCHWSCFGQ